MFVQLIRYSLHPPLNAVRLSKTEIKRKRKIRTKVGRLKRTYPVNILCTLYIVIYSTRRKRCIPICLKIIEGTEPRKPIASIGRATMMDDRLCSNVDQSFLIPRVSQSPPSLFLSVSSSIYIGIYKYIEIVKRRNKPRRNRGGFWRPGMRHGGASFRLRSVSTITYVHTYMGRSGQGHVVCLRKQSCIAQPSRFGRE